MSHLVWMSFVVKKDVTLDPGDITLFGTIGIVLASYGLTNPIEKLLRTLFNNFFSYLPAY